MTGQVKDTYVEVVYLDSPPMLSSIDSRTPNKVNGYGDIAELRQRGFTVTPLVPMPPERVDALEWASKYLGNEFNDEYGLGELPVIVKRLEALHALLREARGEVGDGQL